MSPISQGSDQPEEGKSRIGRGTVHHAKGVRRFGRLFYPISATQRALMRANLVNKPPLPDFLGIGVPKAGTTWLYGNLRAHPKLFLPDRKEIHYFDQNWFQPLGWYSELFDDAGDRLRGEITPAYCSLPPRRIRALHALMPDLKLLMLLRDPVARDWSHLRMMFLRQRGRDPGDVTTDEYIEVARSHPRMERGDYLEMLQRWLDVVDRENLFIGFQEQIVNRPKELLLRVFGHIGLAGPHPWGLLPVSTRLHTGIEAPMPPPVGRFLVERHLAEIEQLVPILGASPVAEWRSQWERTISSDS